MRSFNSSILGVLKSGTVGELSFCSYEGANDWLDSSKRNYQ